MATATTAAPTSHRNPALDGVRGLAIVLVVVSHAGVPLVRYGATTGLTLFFGLSGYLITAILLREHRRFDTISLGAFYLRRALRLLPAVVALVLATVALNAVFDFQPMDDTLRGAGLTLVYGANFAGLLDVELGPFRFLWSLALEEQFYLLWPICLLGYLSIARRRTPTGEPVRTDALVGILLAVSLASIVIRFLGDPGSSDGFELAYYLPHTNVFTLALGCAAAVWFESRPVPSPRTLGQVSLVIILVWSTVIGLRTGLREAPGSASLIWRLAIAPGVIIPCVALVAAAAATPKAFPLLTMRTMRWFGTISYGLYLWHGPMITLFLSIADLDDGSSPKAVLVKLAAVGASVGMAALSYRFVETPFLRRKARAERASLADGDAPPAAEVALPATPPQPS